jgi:hypothetical protein
MISYTDKKIVFDLSKKWERPTWASLKQRFIIGPIETLHYQLFTYYLDHMGTWRAALIKKVLPTSYRKGTSKLITELIVPHLWQKKLFASFNEKSVMYGEVRLRINASDHVIQPTLNTNITGYKQGGSIPVDEDIPRGSIPDTYSQLVIDKKLKKFRFLNFGSRIGYKHLNQELMESVSSQIAEFIDKSLVSPEPNTENTVLESILTTPGLFDHESEGMQTKGGYVDVPGEIYSDGADPLKTCLFHTVQGYRQRAKWMMNSSTGLQIAVMKDGQGNYLIDQRDDALRTVGVPDRLLNKPIRYNEHMPDIGIVGMIADFTRGYIISPSKELTLVIDEIADDITLKMYIGGKVMQPTAFKGYRYIERSEEEVAAAREKTRLANEKWWAEYHAKEAEKAKEVPTEPEATSETEKVENAKQ